MSAVHPDTKTINKFGGLFARGGYDNVPPDHAALCSNVAWDDLNCLTMRDGLLRTGQILVPNGQVTLDAHNVVVNYTNRFLALASNFIMYQDGAVAINSWATGQPRSLAIQAYANRVYYSPYNWAVPGSIPGNGLVHWYNGTITVPAAGSPPVSAPVLAQVGAGNVTAGNHAVAIAFETATGFITPIGPAATINSTGVNRIELSSIPTGPAGTVGRRIVVTRANGTEYFFAPGGNITDNTTLTWNLDFQDTELILSADYLLDLVPAIQYCTQILEYHNRNVYLIGGAFQPKTRLYVSKPNDPESISTIDGYIDLPNPEVDDLIGAIGAVVNRDVLYISTKSGCFYVVDNGNEPANWQVLPLDDAAPFHARGITQYKASKGGGVSNDVTLIANEAGLWKFSGGFPEVPLSWKIDTLWRGILKQDFNLISMTIDPRNKVLFIVLPTASTSYPLIVYAMDFKEGLNPETVKWTPHSYALGVTSLMMRKPLVPISTDIGVEVLHFSTNADHFLYETRRDLSTDDGVAFNVHYFAGPIRLRDGWICTFTGLQYKTEGAGTVNARVLLPNGTPQNFTSFVSAANEARERRVGINYVNERILPGFNTTARVKFSRIDVHGKPTWQEHPG